MEDLKRILMDEIGLYYSERGNVKDQDTLQYVKFRNKNLKQDMTKGFRQNDIVFDPLNSPKQMESLFKYAINKDDIEVLSFANIQNPDGTYKCIVCTNENTSIESNNYNNPALSYAESILTLYGNSNVNLSEYDSEEENNK